MGRLWLGTSGFSYPEWRPAFYPAELPPARFLRHYAGRFNSVEIDSTFYRLPTPKTLESWKAQTGAGFRFSLKASRRITHLGRLRLPSEPLDIMLEAARRLDDRFGALLFQLPPFLRRDDGLLERFLAALPPGLRAAFEFRHASWFDPAVFGLLRARDVALCVNDELETPLELTAPFTMVRLRRPAYSPDEVEAWRRRFRAWDVDVYAYVKHKDNPRAPLVAREFASAG